jgi:hemolysin activation/secretion protein
MHYPRFVLHRAALCLLATSSLVATWVQAQQSPPSAPTAPAEPTLDIARYVIDGDNPLSASATENLLKTFAGEKRALGQIEQAAEALEKAIRAEGYVFHRVFVPVQKPKDGAVTLQIIRFSIDQVTLVGNNYFSADNIRRSLPALQEGLAPDIHDVSRDLTAANANPAKQVQVTFRESAKPDAVDASLRIRDNQPLTYFVGYTASMGLQEKNPNDNIYRLTVGLQHANLFDRDQVAALTYTTDPNQIDKVTLFGLYYQLPFYGTGLSLSAYYNSSDVASGQVQGGNDVTGKGQFFGVRLTQALPRWGKLQQTVGVALDNRYSDSGFSVPTIAGPVGSQPLSARYTFKQDEPWGGFSGSVDYAFNLGGGAANDDASYALASNKGDRLWHAWRYALDVSYRWSDWVLAGRLRGQLSDSALINIEQFGLGGIGSVRGFTDRVVSGDSGYSWNVEAVGPDTYLPQLRPVLFVDGGQLYSRLTGQTENLLSVGAGLRWSYQKMELSVDLTQVLQANSAEMVSNPLRLNLSLFYRF